MLHQVTAEVESRLATQVNVLTERVWWISHSLITFSALDIWQNTFHTSVVDEVAGPRDTGEAVLTSRFPSGVLQQLFECLPQSLPDITYGAKTWIPSVWVLKTMPWRKHNKDHTSWHRRHKCSSTCSSKPFFFHESLILRLSDIRPIPWLLTEGEVEVLEKASTWTNLYKFEPATNDRDCSSSLFVLKSYVRTFEIYTRSVALGGILVLDDGVSAPTFRSVLPQF